MSCFGIAIDLQHPVGKKRLYLIHNVNQIYSIVALSTLPEAFPGLVRTQASLERASIVHQITIRGAKNCPRPKTAEGIIQRDRGFTREVEASRSISPTHCPWRIEIRAQSSISNSRPSCKDGFVSYWGFHGDEGRSLQCEVTISRRIEELYIAQEIRQGFQTRPQRI